MTRASSLALGGHRRALCAVAELVHGIYRAETLEADAGASTRRHWRAGQIEGDEAAKGNVPSLIDLMIAATAIGARLRSLPATRTTFQKILGLFGVVDAAGDLLQVFFASHQFVAVPGG